MTMKTIIEILNRFPRIGGAVMGIALHPILSAILLTR